MTALEPRVWRKCLRCGHAWMPHVERPKQCPHCRHKRWWTVPGPGGGPGRPQGAKDKAPRKRRTPEPPPAPPKKQGWYGP